MRAKVLRLVFGFLIPGVVVKTAAGGYIPGFRQEGFHFEAILSAAAADLDSDGQDELILAGRNYLDREVCTEILGWDSGAPILEWRSANLIEPESSLLALPLRAAGGPGLVLLTRSRYRIFGHLDGGYTEVAEGPMAFAAEEGASADLDGDGIDELILSATRRNTRSGREKNLHVLSFSGGAPAVLASSDPVGNIRSLAAGDLDLDGRAEVVAEAGQTTKPGEFWVFRLTEGSLRLLFRQKVPLPGAAYGIAAGRRASGTEPRLFAASQPGRLICFSFSGKGLNAEDLKLSFRGSPVSLAAGDLDGDGRQEIVLVNYPANIQVFTAGEGTSP